MGKKAVETAFNFAFPQVWARTAPSVSGCYFALPDVPDAPPSSQLGWTFPSCLPCPFSWVYTAKLHPRSSGEEKREGIHPNVDEFLKSD